MASERTPDEIADECVNRDTVLEPWKSMRSRIAAAIAAERAEVERLREENRAARELLDLTCDAPLKVELARNTIVSLKDTIARLTAPATPEEIEAAAKEIYKVLYDSELVPWDIGQTFAFKLRTAARAAIAEFQRQRKGE